VRCPADACRRGRCRFAGNRRQEGRIAQWLPKSIPTKSRYNQINGILARENLNPEAAVQAKRQILEG